MRTIGFFINNIQFLFMDRIVYNVCFSHYIKYAVFSILILIAISMYSLGCSDKATSSSKENIEIQFISGYIDADLMPPVPPDPVRCQIELLITNKSDSKRVKGLTVPSADVFLHSNNEKIGTIDFLTDWDSLLLPGEQDTVLLSKIQSSTPVVEVHCRKYVYLILNVILCPCSFDMFKTDSLLFGCVY